MRQPIEPAALLAAVAHESAGAQTAFFGAVRDHNAGRAVTGIDYAAYEPMAEAELAAIAAEAAERWPGLHIAIAHRIGELTVGDVSVGIAVAHAHRGPAFDACRFAIEAIKARVPIWKCEHYVDGSRAWVDASTSGAAGTPPARDGARP
ncbi:MAG: molybdenum cofactor biosynthesis protein MoaE [Gemmatirosa sp.]